MQANDEAFRENLQWKRVCFVTHLDGVRNHAVDDLHLKDVLYYRDLNYILPPMSTFRQIYYQIVFGTRHRLPTISLQQDADLYRYITGIVQHKSCKLYAINGVEDHIHIMTDLHPSVCLSDLVKDIKVASSIWLKEHGGFPLFDAWQEGYGAFTYSSRERDMIINYIRKQKQHHKVESFRDEYRRLLMENEVDFDEKYLL